MAAFFSLTDYNYDLPAALIAQNPLARRSDSRMLVLGKESGVIEHSRFADLPAHLPANAILVVNNSRIAPVRLHGKRASNGRAEMLILTPLPLLIKQGRPIPGQTDWQKAEAYALLKPGKGINLGDMLFFGPDIQAQVLTKKEYGQHDLALSWRGNLAARLDQWGQIPLPPYIKRESTAEDKNRYQTVYAKPDKIGSVAAPTAGLHFTAEIKTALLAKGLGWEEVTLHVGYGTFSPVRTADIRQHVMHREYVEISPQTAQAVMNAKLRGQKIVAVGTTSARTLEGVAAQNGGVLPSQGWSGWIDLFIYPGYVFQIVDALFTNFHLPQSTLLMLVAALGGRERILRAYSEAVLNKYRFFSYGDAMLVK